MKQLIPFLAIHAALCVFTQASADGCRRAAPVQTYAPVVRHQTIYHDPYQYHAQSFLAVPYANYSIYGIDPLGELPALREELARLRETIAAGQQKQPGPYIPPQQMPEATPPVKGTPPTKAATPPTKEKAKASATQPPKWAAYAKAACVKCHSETGRQDKGLVVVMADGRLADPGPLMRKEMFLRVSLNEMPQGGKAPDDEALQELAEWAKGK